MRGLAKHAVKITIGGIKCGFFVVIACFWNHAT